MQYIRYSFYIVLCWLEHIAHKSERTDAASASLYSYPQDSNLRAAYKKLQKNFFCIKQLFSADAKLFSKKKLINF